MVCFSFTFVDLFGIVVIGLLVIAAKLLCWILVGLLVCWLLCCVDGLVKRWFGLLFAGNLSLWEHFVGCFDWFG